MSQKACVQYVTCVVCMMVRSFIRDTPGPMAALSPAVPNSIRAPKHFCSSDMALSLTIDRTAAAVFGFCKHTQKIYFIFTNNVHSQNHNKTGNVY